jgi:phenylalanyl-tRNA synthetase beta chain
MKVSYRWLNEYFDGKLPPVEKVVDVLTMNSSEVDGIEKIDGDDWILDVKILPNMAHSCLCHRGIARELSALLDLPMKKYSRELNDVENIKKSILKPDIKIENKNDCRRYVGRVIENVEIRPSPAWLKKRLENLGQRSINNLVDATNFVMLELGQPMHVFDCGKIGGSLIEIKRAKAGDDMKTLDGKEVVLDESILTISNNSKALAIAGVKGGTLAEIDEHTKSIILESANFDPALIRKTAQKLKIQTDASKRYENDLTPELCWEAMDILTKLIVEIASTEEIKVGKIIDAYQLVVSKSKLSVSPAEVEKVLGLKINEKEIEDIFRRFDFTYKKVDDQIVIDVPFERLDLKIKEDLIEEIGRVYGYDKLIDSTDIVTSTKGKINKSFYYANKIKKILCENGFSEIYGYTFSEKGDIELANSVAPEKKWLRNNLMDGMKNYLEFNARYSELVAMPQIKIFEIGKVFKMNDEHNNLVIGVKTPVGVKGLKKDADVISEVTGILKLGLNVDKLEVTTISSEGNIAEFNFDEIVAELPEPKEYDVVLPVVDKEMRFKKISTYPFILRDVAVFTPEGTDSQNVLNIIMSEAGQLLVKYRLFDTFTKKFSDGNTKTSYAYHLVFQSFEKTLSDEEINIIMEKIVSKLNTNNGWQVR